jgi:hypothetical protein
MSALGHKRTYAVHKPMSALPPIATLKADMSVDRAAILELQDLGIEGATRTGGATPPLGRASID